MRQVVVGRSDGMDAAGGEYLQTTGKYKLCAGVHGEHVVSERDSRGFACKPRTRKKRVYTHRGGTDS